MFLTPFWLAFGFVGQSMFTARFLVQWIVSEKLRRSTIPDSFWWFSLAGGVMLLVYAIIRRDPVFILGQGAGLVVYLRNLTMIRATKRSAAAA
ncbi:MAG: hypothetical protein DI498_03490 [Paracoccus denitrificans]|nr:MAG: hypothetical protein DI498_03490 [Paracoccus denitrificans]PZO85587.1 MAG: hypothetical protein DI633_03490 [Paracoccus denitrificans]